MKYIICLLKNLHHDNKSFYYTDQELFYLYT